MIKATIYAAALAGLAVGNAGAARAHGSGTSSGSGSAAKEKCFGMNKCKDFAKCSIGKSDVEATKEAFGEKFAKSKLHDCAGDGSCAAAKGGLGWIEVPGGTCIKKEGGFLIVKEGDKKIVKK